MGYGKAKKYLLAHSPLADLIVSKESQNNYNIANKSNSQGKYPAVKDYKLIEMTLKEVMEKQAKGILFATGRYQIIPKTLKEAKSNLNLNEYNLYDEEMQDRIFEEYLINKKRPKVMDYLRGNGSIDVAAHELAKEFASVGVKKGWKLSNGKLAQGGESFYSGIGGNKAHYGAEKIIEALDKTRKQYENYIKLKGY